MGGSHDLEHDKKAPKILPKVPRGLRALPITSLASTPSPRSEFDRLKQEAAQIEQWWTTPRWKHTKRVYSGESNHSKNVVVVAVVVVVVGERPDWKQLDVKMSVLAIWHHSGPFSLVFSFSLQLLVMTNIGI